VIAIEGRLACITTVYSQEHILVYLSALATATGPGAYMYELLNKEYAQQAG